MPDIGNADFREYFYARWGREYFYARWGRENAIICAKSRFAEYHEYRQSLSIKAAWHGREDYFVDNERLAVDDDVYLILNEARRYASRLQSEKPATSFSIFFRPGMANEVLGCLIKSTDELLADPRRAAERQTEFHEHLTPHDKTVSPLLAYLHSVCKSGFDDEAWYEEQLHVLLERMLLRHRRDIQGMNQLSALKRRTRREIFHRVNNARDYIQSNYENPVLLDDVARHACMSPHHFLRSFRNMHGITPYQYLLAKRVRVAARQLSDTTRPITDIGPEVGFDSRSAFYRAFKKIFGVSPEAYRQETRH